MKAAGKDSLSELLYRKSRECIFWVINKNLGLTLSCLLCKKQKSKSDFQLSGGAKITFYWVF